MLLAELAMVEEEILWLERKVEELKLKLYQERSQNREWEMRQQEQPRRLWKQNHLVLCEEGNQSSSLVVGEQRCRSQNYEVLKKERMAGDRRSSMGSASEIQSWFSNYRSNGKK